MKRSDIHPLPEYFDKYIGLVDDVDLDEALRDSLIGIRDLPLQHLQKLGNSTYAPGKWTVREILQHIVDVERILCYRALLIARNDLSVTADFNEQFLSEHSKANHRPLTAIIEELAAQRVSTIALFRSFDEETLVRKGKNWKVEMSVLAFGFLIAGHQTSHLKSVQENYLAK